MPKDLEQETAGVAAGSSQMSTHVVLGHRRADGTGSNAVSDTL
jgi:hypothetical protein